MPASAPQTKDQQHSTAQHRDTSRPAPEAALGGELFNWTHAWYPIAAVTALQKDAPNAQQLLGQRLVVWWDKASSNWRCFEDLCPHRWVWPEVTGDSMQGTARNMRRWLCCSSAAWCHTRQGFPQHLMFADVPPLPPAQVASPECGPLQLGSLTVEVTNITRCPAASVAQEKSNLNILLVSAPSLCAHAVCATLCVYNAGWHH